MTALSITATRTADLYAWYYNTQACLMCRRRGVDEVEPACFQDQLIKNQNPDGSWPPVAGKAPGGELQRDPRAPARSIARPSAS